MAARQHGVVTRRQLLDAEIPSSTVEDRVARSQLVPLHRGVYAAGHASLRREGHWLAAVLAIGHGAVLSHRDAAALHELRPSNGSLVDVSTSAERKSTAKVRVHGRRVCDARDVTTLNGIPVTTVSRTLVDLAEVVAKDALVKACSEAERQHKLDVKNIEEALKRTRGRRGPGPAKIRAALAELAAHGTHLTRSELEDRFIPLLAAYDLPRPATNAHVAGFEGDAVWPQARLVVELDGWGFHNTRRAFQRDRTKGNALVGAGWTVLRFTHDDLMRRPGEVAAQIAAQLSPVCGSARPPRAGDRRAS